MDARDLSDFTDESFDIVLCMGAFYHLINAVDREKCITECLRVLKPNGLLSITYINRNFFAPLLMLDNPKDYNYNFIMNILSNGVIDHTLHICPFTDTYCSTPSEIEEYFSRKNVCIMDHSAIDFITVLKRDVIDAMDNEQFDSWCNIIFEHRHDRDFIGLSNHSLITVKKN